MYFIALVYEVLYDGVYQLKDLPYAVEKMLHDKVPSNHIEYFMSENVERRKKQKERAKIFIEASNEEDKDRNNNTLALKCKHHTEDLERASLLKESMSIFVFNRSLIQLENVCMNCLNVNSAKDLLDNGITPFPYKVAKALDPDIYRNIEFDVWSELRRALVYEVLYDGVYQLKDLPYAVEKMLHDKVPSNHIEYFMSENVERRKKQKERAKIFIEASNEEDKDRNNNTLALKCKHHTEDLERASLLKESMSIFVFNRSLIQLENVCMNCLNVNSAKDLLDNGITPFPYKVAKALDPDIYRNIEFDVWSELRREMRFGARYCDGTTLQVGVKCLCKLQPEQSVPYQCHIQEMSPDGGPCLVFIEELGEKRVVDFDQLEPLPVEQIKPWAPPYRYSRANSQILNLSQMLQQIGNITRKQGLNKARKAKGEDIKTSDNAQTKSQMNTEINNNYQDVSCYTQAYTYPHLDYMNFQPMPVSYFVRSSSGIYY
ncbi:jg10628 [Pararge aegeria aegeria]|uniref:Jg10628 protein n=1 Tax=Pararge aegeria aegeria TaxID=348720 RepID=A0A8S4RD96_9NEOP|nr:jg10628 [Pararge aegeria aegeria]